MSNETHELLETLGAVAIAALHKKGLPALYVNPDLTGEKTSIAFELYIGSASYGIEIFTEENELKFFVDGENVLGHDWFSALEKEANKN